MSGQGTGTSLSRAGKGRIMKKRAVALLLTLCMAMGMSITANAAETRIEKVEIEFSWDQEPKQGERPGNISAKSKSDQYRVGDVYYNNDIDDYWMLGDTPEVVAVIHAANGYRFSSTSRSYFTISGQNAKYKRAKTYDSGTTLELTVTFPQLTGRLQQVENNYWEDNIAVWDDMESAKSYEIRLYRDDKLQTTVKSDRASYDFSGSFTREGEYSFKVRGIARYNDRAGDWSEMSDYNFISARQAQSTPISGGWQQDAKGWWYAFSGGGYPASTWREINGAWYYFNKSGYMVTGWQNLDGNWYYLMPNGAMATGWQFINNRWYYLNNSGVMLTGWQDIGGRRYFLDGSGAMMTGWQYINGSWYCFDASGALYTSTRTPDGFYVDSWGIWR